MENTKNSILSHAINLTKDDLLAVGVANYEQGLLKRKKALTEEYTTAGKRIEEIAKERAKLCGEAAEGVKVKEGKALIRAFKRFGESVTIKREVCRIKEDEGVMIVKVVLQMKVLGFNQEVHNLLCIEEVELPKGVIELGEEHRKLTERQEELRSELNEVLDNLRNLSTKEREVKAHLVIQTLQTTEEGRALLETLTKGGNPFQITVQDD